MTTRRKLGIAVIILLCNITLLMSSFFGTTAFAHAETQITSLSTTYVMTDLEGATINGKPFSQLEYPKIPNAEPELLTFMEYCYSEDPALRQYYGLYVYVYNPGATEFAVSGNKLQLAVTYGSDGKPKDYSKFTLKLCSRSRDNNNKNLFYKFKVEDPDVSIFARVNKTPESRRYDVSGMELRIVGEDNARDYKIGSGYIYSGYAKGCSLSSVNESTLECTCEDLTTVELDVKHTYYRTKTSSRGAGHQNQIDTVYFTVPQRFFDDYEKLQRIKAEWYEYRTRGVVVTSNADFYNAVLPYIGKSDLTGMGWNAGINLPINPVNNYITPLGDWVYGNSLAPNATGTRCKTLYYLFNTNGKNISSYDPYGDVEAQGGVSGNKLYEYIKSYDKSFNSGRLPIKDGNISADLFHADIDESRKIDNERGKIQFGYSYYDFDVELDMQSYSSWNDTNPGVFNNIAQWGFWTTLFGEIPKESGKDYSPIVVLSDEDFKGTAQEISDRLLINFNDVEKIRRAYTDATTVNGEDEEAARLVLFRFATTDYASESLILVKDPIVPVLDYMTGIEGEAYIASESVFFDFDVIQLGFYKDEELHVIPCVSSPIDMVSDITPPTVVKDHSIPWWVWLVAFFALYIALRIISIFVGPIAEIFKFLRFIISLPFRGIAALVRSIKNRKDN